MHRRRVAPCIPVARPDLRTGGRRRRCRLLLQRILALNPPAWSLAIELQFYAIAPFLFVFMANRRTAAIILVLSFCAWVPFTLNWMSPLLPAYVLTFALGVGYARFPRHDWAIRLAPVGLVTFVLVLLIPNLFGPVPLDSVWRFGVVVSAMIMLPYVAASLSKLPGRRDRTLGDLAYPVYLFHWPMFLIAARLAPEHSLGLALLLTAVVSVILLWLVDRPLEKWRHAFVDGRVRQRPEHVVMAHPGSRFPDVGGSGTKVGEGRAMQSIVRFDAREPEQIHSFSVSSYRSI